MESASGAVELSRRFDDPELHVFSRLGLALVHARRGNSSGAGELFDEIMVGVTIDNVSPVAVGVVYCAVIDGCHALLDLGRAREWTAALDRWCSAQPDLVAFRGKCLVHRTPHDFMWQYIYCTPLMALLPQSGNAQTAALERDVVAGWQPWVTGGGMKCEQSVLVSAARRSA
jgi:hypothetical protein